MKKAQIIITNEVGLHARPASVFVQAAKQFNSQISIRNITTNSAFSDARSILGVLVLGIEKNHLVEIEVKGDDEEKAFDNIVSLIKSDFRPPGMNK